MGQLNYQNMHLKYFEIEYSIKTMLTKPTISKLEENNIDFCFSISIEDNPEYLHPDLPIKVEDLEPKLETLEIDVPTIYIHIN